MAEIPHDSRILVIEDDAEQYEQTRGLLTAARGTRAQIEWARAFADGLEAVVQRTYDACLIDDELCGRSGVELVREARRRGVRAPLILLASHGDPALDIEARLAGADDFLSRDHLTAAQLERTTWYAIERFRALERMRESEDKYRLLFNANPVPTWVMDAETQRFLAVNDAAVCQYGYSRDEFASMSAFELNAATSDARTDPPRADAAIVADLPDFVPLRHRRKDGRLLDVEVSYQNITLEGRPAIMGLARDVTESVRAAIALRESEERFRELAEHVRVIFFVTDPVGRRTLYVSPAYETLFEQTLEHVTHTPTAWLERVHPEDRDRVRTCIAQPVGEVEFRIVRTDGEVRYVRRQTAAVRDAAGRVVRIVGTGEDVTELRRAQRHAETASKMEAVGRLAGGVAHDFNNVLTAIMGETELLMLDLPPDHPGRGSAEEILASGRRAADLTKQLLAFSRQQVFQLRVLDLNALLNGMDRMLRRLMGEDVELWLVPAPDVGSILADAGQIEQVIMNLAVNGRQAMRNGGRLTLQTTNLDLNAEYAARHEGLRAGPYVCLTVQDEGVGMSEDVKSHIFEPFFTTKGVGEGTGLGLATVYGIVKQTGGYILVDSEVGRGTTFRVFLPRVMDEVMPRPPRPAVDMGARGSETVLVVEDDEAARAIAARILSRQGYVVLQARTGAEAIEVAAGYRGPIHVMLCDIVMPRMTGPQTYTTLRVTRPDLRVLYMSGYTDRAVVHQYRLEEGNSFLQKPFTPEALLQKIREELDAP